MSGKKESSKGDTALNKLPRVPEISVKRFYDYSQVKSIMDNLKHIFGGFTYNICVRNSTVNIWCKKRIAPDINIVRWVHPPNYPVVDTKNLIQEVIDRLFYCPIYKVKVNSNLIVIRKYSNEELTKLE